MQNRACRATSIDVKFEARSTVWMALPRVFTPRPGLNSTPGPTHADGPVFSRPPSIYHPYSYYCHVR